MYRYLGYKDSGIGGIGEIPKHWEVKRLAVLGKFSKGKTITKSNLSSDGFPCILYGELYTRYDRCVTEPHSRIGKELFLKSTKVSQGAFLLTSSGETAEEIGKCLLVMCKDKVAIGGDSMIFRLYDCNNFDVEFLSFVLNSNYCRHYKASNSRGEIVVHIYEKQLRDLRIAYPDRNEQSKISKFLVGREETINQLIKKLERKIELLKEHRVALINQCVTKGLDPNVEMKDSNIEWIGKIPRNWEMIKLKYVADSNDNVLSETTDPEYSFTYIQIGDVDHIEGITLNEPISFRESPSRARRITKPGDVIISTVRTYLKAIGTIPNVSDVICSTGFCVIRGKKGVIEQEFLAYSVTSECFISFVICNSDGVSYPAINAPDLVDLKIALPSAEEQLQISQYLDKKTFQIDRLVEKHKRKIKLLKEYRNSLISIVVTGKIRVTE